MFARSRKNLLHHVKTLGRRLEQEGVPTEVRWLKSHARVVNVLAQECKTAAEVSLCRREGEWRSYNVRWCRDESTTHMDDREQRDGSVSEQEVCFLQNVARVKRALQRLHTKLGRPGVEEMSQVLKRGGSSSCQLRRHDECIVASVLKTCNSNSRGQQLGDKCWTLIITSVWTSWVCIAGETQQDQWNVQRLCVTRLCSRRSHRCGLERRLWKYVWRVKKNGNFTVPLIKERVGRPPDAQYVTGTLTHDNDHGESDSSWASGYWWEQCNRRTRTAEIRHLKRSTTAIERWIRVEHRSAGSVVQERSAQLTKKNYDPSCGACSNGKRLTVEEVYGIMSKMFRKQNRGRGCSRARGEGLHRVPWSNSLAVTFINVTVCKQRFGAMVARQKKDWVQSR